MRKIIRTLFVGFASLVALLALAGCSGNTGTDASPTSEAAPTSSAAAFPPSARYVADMTSADGKTMTIGISVDGGEVAAYACNGTDDEAWFFGKQTDGRIDLASRFRDTLRAELAGTDVTGDLTMNGVAYQFTAAPVSGEAGMYTAALDGVRASWVVREDGSAIGVQLNGTSGRDFEQAELQQLSDLQFRNEVRNKRQLQQAQQITRLANGSMSSKINGRDVTPTLVTGTFRLT
ncbi:hypothetical protein H7J88_15610 [Mycolicibacterium flavescens]|uniref:Uncharacterized protein n=1 Tax=Mycolicibacterium flavescens TaxID=1776 RepID=A0A1E3RKG4_MYCFV|nr:hypothetical protein [Mycolicibacterium flavescens]MCV7281070.1 hypothetical protein [Mycolicibacterium flavescens]ODQ90366.1 hypothetical protein BHQ18_09900 [Mycolicibacterium flavescens]